FIEDLYAQFLEDPSAVDPQWQDFFRGLGEDAAGARAWAKGAPWQARDWPPSSNGDLITALGGESATRTTPLQADRIAPVLEPKPRGGETPSTEDVRRATLDSVRTLMMIRAYRMRGHLAADLDPLKLRAPEPQPELDPETYGFGPGDLDRPIFID